MADYDLAPIDLWLETISRQGKSTHTFAAYRRALTHFAQWLATSYGQHFDPTQVIARDLRDWKIHQQTVEKAAPATINQRLTAVTQFFAWAESGQLVRTNPARGITGVPTDARRPKGLGEKKLRRLLRAAHAGGDVRDIALVELLAGSGLRVGELLALQIEDLTLNPRSGQVVVRKGKHGRYRTVPLTAVVRQALEAYLAIHPQGDNPKAALFWGERGPLRDRKAVARILAKYAQVAGIAAFGPHTLRHTFASSYLAANPQDVRGLAALLGHASLDTVMIYTEPSLDDLAERMERVEQR